MLPCRVIIAFVLMSLISMSCLALVLIDLLTYDVDDPVLVDPNKITGNWYVVGAKHIDAKKFPKFRCWTVDVVRLSEEFYEVITTFTDPMTKMKKVLNFQASTSNETQGVLVYDHTWTFKRLVVGFTVRHIFSSPNLLFLTMFRTPGIPRDNNFILSSEPTFTEQEKFLVRPDVYVNNTEC